MNKLDKIAIENLKLLENLNENIEDYQLVINGHVISQSGDDNYEGIFNLQELEYPIYFSFQQLFTSIRYSNLYKIEGYKTNDLIKLMDNSIDKIVTILEKTEDDPHNESLCEIIDEIDDKYIILSERNKTCSFWKVFETFNDYLDSVSEVLINCNRFVYITKLEEYIEGEESVDNEETEELNPNLVYSDAEGTEDENEEPIEEEVSKKIN